MILRGKFVAQLVEQLLAPLMSRSLRTQGLYELVAGSSPAKFPYAPFETCLTNRSTGL